MLDYKLHISNEIWEYTILYYVPFQQSSQFLIPKQFLNNKLKSNLISLD